MTKKESTTKLLLKTLYDRSNFLLSLLLFFISILVIFAGFQVSSPDWKNILVAIGSSLMASVIFSYLYTSLVNKQLLSLIENAIDQNIEKLNESVESKLTINRNTILDTFKTFNKEYLPTRIFGKSNNPTLMFDNDIFGEVKRTKEIIFRGISGKRTAMRIFESNSNFQSVRIELINPKDIESMQKRAIQKLLIEKSELDSENIEKMIKKLEDNFFLCLAGLFYYCRGACDLIEITFLDSSPSSRVEIYDDALYLSKYGGENVRYPETLKFNNQTRIYQFYREDCRKEFNYLKSKSCIEIDSSTTIEGLNKQMEICGLETINEDFFLKFKKKFDEIFSEFRKDKASMQEEI